VTIFLWGVEAVLAAVGLAALGVILWCIKELLRETRGLR